jgi:hypothetical protein
MRSFAKSNRVWPACRHFGADDSLLGTFSTDILYECLTRDKLEMIPTYLSLYRMTESIDTRSM